MLTLTLPENAQQVIGPTTTVDIAGTQFSVKASRMKRELELVFDPDAVKKLHKTLEADAFPLARLEQIRAEFRLTTQEILQICSDDGLSFELAYIAPQTQRTLTIPKTPQKETCALAIDIEPTELASQHLLLTGWTLQNDCPLGQLEWDLCCTFQTTAARRDEPGKTTAGAVDPLRFTFSDLRQRPFNKDGAWLPVPESGPSPDNEIALRIPLLQPGGTELHSTVLAILEQSDVTLTINESTPYTATTTYEVLGRDIPLRGTSAKLADLNRGQFSLLICAIQGSGITPYLVRSQPPQPDHEGFLKRTKIRIVNRTNSSVKITKALSAKINELQTNDVPTQPKLQPSFDKKTSADISVYKVETEKGILPFEFYFHHSVMRRLTIAIDLGSFSVLAGMIDQSADGKNSVFDQFNLGPKIRDPLADGSITDHEMAADTVLSTANIANGLVPPVGILERNENARNFPPPDTSAGFVSVSRAEVTKSDFLDPGGASLGNTVPVLKADLFAGQKTVQLPLSNGEVCEFDVANYFASILHDCLSECFKSDLFKERTSKLEVVNPELECVGIAFSHPGHLDFETFTALTDATLDVLKRLHTEDTRLYTLGFQGRPAEQAGLVRAFPEPVAAACHYLHKHPSTRFPLTVLDVGKRTFDVAVVSRADGEQLQTAKLLACGGADLGGQTLDYCIAEGITEILSGRYPDCARHIAERMPLSDARLRSAFNARLTGTQPAFETYARFQSILRAIETSKRQLSQKQSIVLEVSPDRTCVNPMLDWFNQLTISRIVRAQERNKVASSGAVKITFDLEELLKTKAIERYGAAVRAFLEQYVENGQLEGGTLVRVGRASTNPIIDPVIKAFADANDLRQTESLPPHEAKSTILRGIEQLLKDHSILLSNPSTPKSVVFTSPDGRIQAARALTTTQTDTFKVPSGCAGIALASVHVDLIAAALADAKTHPEGNARNKIIDWWTSILMIAPEIKRALPVNPSDDVSTSNVSIPSSAQTVPRYIQRAQQLGRMVEVYTVETKSDRTEWYFVLNGATMQ